MSGLVGNLALNAIIKFKRKINEKMSKQEKDSLYSFRMNI